MSANQPPPPNCKPASRPPNSLAPQQQYTITLRRFHAKLQAWGQAFVQRLGSRARVGVGVAETQVLHLK